MIMSAELEVVHTGSDLTITSDQQMWNDKQVAALRQLGVKDATNADLAVFFHQAQRTGLDPFAKQIYLISRWTKDGVKQTIQTGIDGFRLVARRAADRAGETLSYEDTQWCGDDAVWRHVWLDAGHPAAAKVVVVRDGQRFPAIAKWSEYVQTTKDGSPNAMWTRMGASQLEKCAEAKALRRAFPQDLSGLYSTDELSNSATQPAVRQRRVTAAEIMADADESGLEPIVGETVDLDTGEVTDGPNSTAELPLADEPPGWEKK
jgi:phage recombination protein Bet